jgi:hypothetical protein
MFGLSAPLRILCRLTSRNRQVRLAVGREPGHIKHCRSVITQRGKKTIGSGREIRLI